jgi:hypothetical protein
MHEVLMGERNPTLALPGVEQNGQETFKQAQVDKARAAYQKQFDRRAPKAKPKAIPIETSKLPKLRTPPVPVKTSDALMDAWFANMADG